MQSVRRIATDGKIRGSKLGGRKIITTSPRPYVLLCLNNARIIRKSVGSILCGKCFLNAPHVVKLILLYEYV